MSQWIVSNFFTSLTTLLLGVFVFFSNRKSNINRIFCLYSLSISEWSFFTAFHAFTNSESLSFFSAKIMHLGVPLIPILFFHFCLVISNSYNKHKNKLFVGYFISSVLIILNFISNLIVLRVRPKLGYHYFMDGGILYPFLILSFIIYTIFGLYLLLKGCFVSTGNKRNQLKYLFSGSLLGYIFGTSCFLPVYDITIFPYPVGSYAISAYVFITTYAILKYRLLDINLALTRAGIFIIVYTLVLGLPFWFGFTTGKWIYATIVMAVLGTAGPFLYIYLQHRAEKILFKEQHRYQQSLRHASMGMTRIRDLNKLLNLIVHIITKTVKITHASIFLLDSKTNQYHLQAHRDREKIKEDFVFDENSPLVLYLKLERRPLVNEEIKQNIEQNTSPQALQLRSEIEKLSASLVVPSFVEDKLIGFLVLGEKISGKIYTTDDLLVFSVLANQAALAIENAIFFKESKEFQGRIAQAEKMATIGTMANGLSHQINNRLHAISMITGDTYDLLKYIDINSCSEGVKESFDQIKHALERTKENIRLGREIVQGILKYSSPNQEGLQELSLDEVFDNAMAMAQYKVKVSEFDFEKNYPKDLAKIKGNLGQLQEVFFNLIDNAYYAICERREFLKEDDYRGKISASAELLKDKFIRIMVQDNGIGVKEEDFMKLFTPFFTTKASSKGGSGLGLYVIKQIVEQNHKGKINMESTYKQGTMFIVELPIV